MATMVKHLASLADRRLILSFAPSTPALLLLKRIGEFFPKGSKVRNVSHTPDWLAPRHAPYMSKAVVNGCKLV